MTHPQTPGRGNDPHQGKGDGGHDRDRRRKRLEPPHDKDVDQHENRGKSQPQVPEDLVGDVPFPVPLHRKSLVRSGLAGDVPFHPVSAGHREVIQRLVDREDRVDGGLHLPRPGGGRGPPPPAPSPAGRRVAATCSADTPFKAAFSWSTANRYLGWSSSTYQSTSTTPSVFSRVPRTCRATSICPRHSGP